MLTILTEDGNEYGWHINHPSTWERLKKQIPAETVKLISADGDELVAIYFYFRAGQVEAYQGLGSIPFGGFVHVKWRAPWAQFIFDNFS